MIWHVTEAEEWTNRIHGSHSDARRFRHLSSGDGVPSLLSS
jgi:hypothetical protein